MTRSKVVFSEIAFAVACILFGTAWAYEWSLRALVFCGFAMLLTGMRTLADDILVAIYESKGNK